MKGKAIKILLADVARIARALNEAGVGPEVGARVLLRHVHVHIAAVVLEAGEQQVAIALDAGLGELPASRVGCITLAALRRRLRSVGPRASGFGLAHREVDLRRG